MANRDTMDALGYALQADSLFARLPAWVIDTLTAEQRDAIHQAVCDPSLRHPPINVRFSLPAFGRRYFLTIIGGVERRGARRRTQERTKYPMRTVANFLFFVFLGVLIYALSIASILIHRSLTGF
ncbi:MAG: hypothetical protein ACE5FR_08040 [Rhodospirillales bacterium]